MTSTAVPGERAIWRFSAVERGLTIHKYWPSACPKCPLKTQCTIPLADAGMWYAACAAGDQTLGRDERARYQARSRDLLQRAVAQAPGNDYIYGQWSAALYWQGDYRGAWDKVRRQRELGGTPSAQTINRLRENMQEPCASCGRAVPSATTWPAGAVRRAAAARGPSESGRPSR